MKTIKRLNEKVPFIWLITMVGLTISYPNPIKSWDQRIGAQFINNILSVLLCCWLFSQLKKNNAKIGYWST